MTELTQAVIVAVARSSFGKFGGKLSALPAPHLGAIILDKVLERAGVSPGSVDAVYGGVAMMGAATLTPVRQAVLMSSLPETTPSLALDRACCSGMTAIGLAYKDILAGTGEVLLAGGFENLSLTPLHWPRSRKQTIGSVTVEDPLLLKAPVVDRQIAVYTGDESLRHGVSRLEQDEWALASHARYFTADARGYFGFERVPIEVPADRGKSVFIERDESPRQDTTIEKLAALPTIYGGSTVTAGNAPGLNDGAAFLLVVEGTRAKDLGLKPLARILAYTQVAGARTSGTSTPATAITSALRQAQLSLAALDLIEINEAYAATPLVSTLVLANGDKTATGHLRAKTNIHGGAVAIGHPLGASGARLVMTLVAGLRERGGGRGAAAICGGFGQGDAIIVEATAA
jgi:acetyl-CoA C-acetyltransferase